MCGMKTRRMHPDDFFDSPGVLEGGRDASDIPSACDAVHCTVSERTVLDASKSEAKL